jgi:formamidopyrimidine-DNA glycosylase
MPEVAEVRIIMDDVQRFLLNNILLEIQTLNDSFRDKRTKSLSQLDLPQKVIKVGTKGKFAYIQLANGESIGIGFGMSGNIRIEPTAEYLKIYNKNRGGKAETATSYLKHAMLRIKYEKEDGSSDHFYYHDVRRFGFWHHLSAQELKKKIDSFGPDVLQEQDVPAELIVQRFRRRNHCNICDALINKSDILSGIGNYIKAEILWDCYVYPLAQVKDLDDATLYALYKSACRVAYEGYMSGGASLYTFTGLNGDRSAYKQELKVYNRRIDPDGLAVTTMETPDKRTTHWVPTRQVVGDNRDNGNGDGKNGVRDKGNSGNGIITISWKHK